MADFGISEFLIGVFGAEAIGTALFNVWEAITGFLGEEGSWLMLDIVPNLTFSGIETSYETAVLDSEGIVRGFGPEVTKIFGVNIDKFLRLAQIVSKKMAENGIQWASSAGKTFYKEFMNKVSEYGPKIALGAGSATLAGLYSKYLSKNKTPEEINERASLNKAYETPFIMIR